MSVRRKAASPPTGQFPAAASASDLFGRDDIEIRAVEVPEWQRTVYVRALPVNEAIEIAKKMDALKKEDRSETMFILLAATICDAEGRLLLTREEDVARLRKRSAAPLFRLQTVALELQGWEKTVEGQQAKNG